MSENKHDHDNEENLTDEQKENRKEERKTVIVDRIKRIIEQFDITYIPIEDEPTLVAIFYLLFCSIAEPDEKVTGIKAYYYGVYYHMKRNEELMHKYYKKALEYGYEDALAYIGYFYDGIKKYKKMKKWYSKGIKIKNARCMFNLASHYHFVRINRKKAEKWYRKAIKYGCKESYINYGFFNYEKKDFDQMHKYYFLAIENEEYDACFNLATFYNKKGEYDDMLRYLRMGARHKNATCIKFLNKLFQLEPADNETKKKAET